MYQQVSTRLSRHDLSCTGAKTGLLYQQVLFTNATMYFTVSTGKYLQYILAAKYVSLMSQTYFLS